MNDSPLVEVLTHRRRQLLEQAVKADDLYAVAHLGVEAARIRVVFPEISWIIVQAGDTEDVHLEYDYRASTVRDRDGTAVEPRPHQRDGFEGLLDEFCYALREARDGSRRWPVHYMITDAGLGFAVDAEAAVDAEKTRRGQTPYWVVVDIDELMRSCQQLIDTGEVDQPVP